MDKNNVIVVQRVKQISVDPDPYEVYTRDITVVAAAMIFFMIILPAILYEFGYIYWCAPDLRVNYSYRY